MLSIFPPLILGFLGIHGIALPSMTWGVDEPGGVRCQRAAAVWATEWLFLCLLPGEASYFFRFAVSSDTYAHF